MSKLTPNVDEESSSPKDIASDLTAVKTEDTKASTTAEKETRADTDGDVDSSVDSASAMPAKKSGAWKFISVLSLGTAAVFGKLWTDEKSDLVQAEKDLASYKTKLSEGEEKVAELKQLTLLKDQKIAENAKTFSEISNQSAQQLLQAKQEIDSGIERQDQEKLALEQQWQTILGDSLDISQEIYAMKWQSNSRVLADMENTSFRSQEVCARWEHLVIKLEPYPEFAKHRAELQVRLSQAYASMGVADRVRFDHIAWEVSELEKQRSQIEAHTWYKLADRMLRLGQPEEAKKYALLSKTAAESIVEDSEKPGTKDYYTAMTTLLEADLIAELEPQKAMDGYLLACEHLAKIMTAFPANQRIKSAFVQAAIDGETLGDSVSNAGKAEKLNKEAYKKLLALMAKYPNLIQTKPALAEAKVYEAEQMVKSGDPVKAQKALDEAKKILKEAGGDQLLTASIESTQAFIAWDNGQRNEALKIMETAIQSVKKIKANDPQNRESSYRLASLYWVRSAMQVQPSLAIEDSQTSMAFLAELVNSGAGKREAAARRMIAIICSDIGQQAYATNQKPVAKKYYIEAQKQWTLLTSKWGPSDEYTEGERHSASRIKNL